MKSTQSNLDGPFAILFQDSRRRLERVEIELAAIKDEFGGRVEDRGYRLFAEVLQLAAHGIRRLVTERSTHFEGKADDPEGQQAEYEALGGDAIVIGDQLEEYLPELKMHRPQQLEVFAVPFTRLAKQIVGNVEVLFFSWAFDGYEAKVYDAAQLRAVDPRLSESMERIYGADIKFIKLWHPGTRERDIFHHVVFAHELAHVALQQKISPDHLLDEDKPPKPGLEPSYATVGNSLLKEEGLPQERAERRLRWFTELACDIFAMRILGPAFAIAFAEVTSANRPLEPQEGTTVDHPPAQIRFRFLQEEIKRFFPEDSPEYELLLPYITPYRGVASSSPNSNTLSHEEAGLQKAIEKFRAYLPCLLGDAEYQPGRLQGDLDLVRGLAERGIPPAERILASSPPPPGDPQAKPEEWSRPIDWRSILNGVLLWHLEKSGFPHCSSSKPAPSAGDEEEESTPLDRAHAVQLAFGGLELTELRARADYLRKQYERMRPTTRLDSWDEE